MKRPAEALEVQDSDRLSGGGSQAKKSITQVRSAGQQVVLIFPVSVLRTHQLLQHQIHQDSKDRQHTLIMLHYFLKSLMSCHDFAVGSSCFWQEKVVTKEQGTHLLPMFTISV